jgi:hypothetical protein
MNQSRAGRLLLDEMFSPAIAAALRDLGHDVIAVAERGELRAMTDEEVFAWATAQGRWLLTENVKDFRPILVRAASRHRHGRRSVHKRSRLPALQEEPRPSHRSS